MFELVCSEASASLRSLIHILFKLALCAGCSSPNVQSVVKDIENDNSICVCSSHCPDRRVDDLGTILVSYVNECPLSSALKLLALHEPNKFCSTWHVGQEQSFGRVD